LRYNPALLVMTVFGLGLVFLAPWWLMLTQSGTAGWGGGFAVAWMVALYLPVLAFYRRPRLWALALPLVAVFYLGCTLYSAWAYYRGRGECGKGGRKPQHE
jgi:hypothetical protein